MHVPIDDLLAARGMSCYDLAMAVEKLGVSQQAAYRLCREHGHVKRLDMRLLSAICHVLNVGVKDVLVHEPKPLKRKRTRKRSE